MRATCCRPHRAKISDSVISATLNVIKHTPPQSAAGQLCGLGKTIVLAGKSSFAMNLLDRNSTIPRGLLSYRISAAKGSAPNVCFRVTDDERIPNQALVIVLSAAKPSRVLLDDDSRFFCRIAYDLARFCDVHSLSIEETDGETLAKSVEKSIEGYLAANGDSALAQWLGAEDGELVEALCGELSRALSDRTFSEAAKMLFRQSETERTARLQSSGQSFELFCRFCAHDSAMQRGFSGLWKTLVAQLGNRLVEFCRSCSDGAEGCFFAEEQDAVRLTLVSDDKDEAELPFAAHPTAQHIARTLFLHNAAYSGNRLVPENYFSNIRYIFRMDEELCERLKKAGAMEKITVAVVGGKPVHALNLVEIGSVTDLESVIKLHSAVGMIVFGESAVTSAIRNGGA